MVTRIRWYTNSKEMMMINNAVTFTAVVDHASDWTEQANTLDDAIDILRDLIESDGHHIFMGIGKWGFNSRGGHANPRIIVKWCDTDTGKTQTKTIRANDIDYQMIASYQTRYLAYLKGKYPEKYRYW